MDIIVKENVKDMLSVTTDLNSNNSKEPKKLGIKKQKSLSCKAYNNFQASKLMFSPKKDKANIKRLYINKKRVPKWA